MSDPHFVQYNITVRAEKEYKQNKKEIESDQHCSNKPGGLVEKFGKKNAACGTLLFFQLNSEAVRCSKSHFNT